MMKVLAIIGSPRKLGNCELMVKEISRRLPIEHSLKLLRLADFKLRACTACYRCLYEDGCVIDDGLGAILDAMAEADAYIVAAPAYFLGANAALKGLMDRGLSFYGRKDSLWGKPSVAVAVAGIEGKEGSALLTVRGFLKSILSDIKASAVVYAALPGEVFFGDEGRETAARLARALSGGAPSEVEPADIAADAASPRCPLCGGDSFRFLGRERLRCLSCGNDGRFSIEAGRPTLDIRVSGHALHLSAEEALIHEAWLRGMKERLVAELPRIRKIREEYRGGDWIRP